MSNHSHMSTQALLDQLAAREQRVLEQLHELSGINQSPITPRHAYASVQATPYGALPSPPSPPSAKSWQEGRGLELHDADLVQRPRGTLGNLELDLQRLQHLLRHSPLHEADGRSVVEEKKDNPTSISPPLQRSGERRDESDVMTMLKEHEKRMRVSPFAPSTGSPVTPYVKRDKRETVSYAPPPLLKTPLTDRNVASRGADSDRAVSLERAVLPRRSEVLDMTEEEEEEREGKSGERQRLNDVVLSPRGCTVPRSGATMFATRLRGEKNAPGIFGYSEARVKPTTPPVFTGQACHTAQWSRSPVRWFASPAEVAGRREIKEDVKDQNRNLCTSAVDAWSACQPPNGQEDEEAVAKLPALRTSVSALDTPPPLHFSLEEASQMEVAHPGAFSAASPPPRLPGTPSPLPKAVPVTASSAAAIMTPAATVFDATPLARLNAPRMACTPQPNLRAYGLLSDSAGLSATTAPPRRAASVLPRGVTHTTSWGSLRAFFARQSRVQTLLTPDLASLEVRSAYTQPK